LYDPSDNSADAVVIVWDHRTKKGFDAIVGYSQVEYSADRTGIAANDWNRPACWPPIPVWPRTLLQRIALQRVTIIKLRHPVAWWFWRWNQIIFPQIQGRFPQIQRRATVTFAAIR
jgi:hypothetical protein